MNTLDKQYQELLQDILDNGVTKSDRTGTGTKSIFGYTIRHNMSEGFPVLTTKKMAWKTMVTELLWFLRGDTNIKFLVDNGCHIWDGDAYKAYEKWYDEVAVHSPFGEVPRMTKEGFIKAIGLDDEFAKKWGDLGPVYGKQWRRLIHHFPKTYSEVSQYEQYIGVKTIDQIANLINDLKKNPDSRRLMVSAWNVGELDQMTLPPCHYGFQCYTTEIDLEQRKKLFCDSLDKHISYAEDLSSDRLDELNAPKRKLSLKWTQRSCDVPLGIPYNIASYGLLLHLLCREVNMVPDRLIFSGGDCHIYLNQVSGVEDQLNNETFKLPKLELSNSSIDELKYDDIKVVGYNSSKTVKFPLSN